MTIINTLRTDSDDEPGLEYKLYTTPHPIRVSPQGADEDDEKKPDPARAQLVFVASNNSRNTVQLKKLTVEIPTGDLAAQLALNLDRVESTISLNGWTASRSGERIEFTTTDPYTEIAPGQGLTFQISQIPVNYEVGAVELRITEGYPGSGQGKLSITTGKFPQDFYLDDFSANTYEIDNGGAVTLTWKRSEGITTDLIYGGECKDVTKEEYKKIEDVRTTTTFYLIGKVGDVQIMRSVLVTVLKPDMVVKNLTVEGALKAQGGAVVYDDFRVTKGEDTENDRALWIGDKTVDLRGLLRLLVSSVYENSGNLEVAESAKITGALAAKGGATVYDDFRVTKGTDREMDRALSISEGAMDVRNKLRLLTSSAYTDSGNLEVAKSAEVTETLTAKGGAVVHDDFRVTKDNDRAVDRILHADKDTVDIRNKLRLKTDSVYTDSGELEVGTSATVGGKHVICYGHEIRLFNKDNGGHLNSTTRHSDCREDWSGKGLANAYWRSNSYDGGSNLRIEKKP